MKTLACKLCVLAVLLGAMGAGVADGQISTSIVFEVSSPFVAGEATMPAGSYQITPWSARPQILKLSDAAGTHMVYVATRPSHSQEPAKSTKLVFNKYGDVLVLKKIEVEGQKNGYLTLPTNDEKEVAKVGLPTEQSVNATTK